MVSLSLEFRVFISNRRDLAQVSVSQEKRSDTVLIKKATCGSIYYLVGPQAGAKEPKKKPALPAA